METSSLQGYLTAYVHFLSKVHRLSLIITVSRTSSNKQASVLTRLIIIIRYLSLFTRRWIVMFTIAIQLISCKATAWIESIYRLTLLENVPWQRIGDNLRDDVLLSMQHYEQIERCLQDMSMFMHILLQNKTRHRSQTHDVNIMCSILEEQPHQITRTTIESNNMMADQSQLINDVIGECR
jgi:hypothetical protein